MSYFIKDSSITCLRCGEVSTDPEDLKLLRCKICGLHAVFRPGMGGLSEEEALQILKRKRDSKKS